MNNRRAHQTPIHPGHLGETHEVVNKNEKEKEIKIKYIYGN
jgi:hypothetical protein